MTDRAARLAAFLDRLGWGAARREPLAGDASFRRYERLWLDGERRVLMDAPPPHEDVGAFVAVGRYLSDLGYAAPQIHGEDIEAGFLLIEDLGDDTYTNVFANGGNEHTLYTAAVDLLADLHKREPAPGLAAYDEAALLAEADLFVDWYLPAVTGEATDAARREAYHAIWRQVLARADIGRPVTVLRDYHADNLMWLAERRGHGRVGLLDFQDALIGSPAYDLASLLEDARRDVAPALATAMIARYLEARPELDAAHFRDAYAVLAAQRNAKIIGIFTRLWKRDGKANYLALIPRVWRLLEGDLAHSALAPVRDWFDRAVPAASRVAPRP